MAIRDVIIVKNADHLSFLIGKESAILATYAKVTEILGEIMDAPT